MLEAEDEEDVFHDAQSGGDDIEQATEQEDLHISVYAISGMPSFKTMRIKGKVKKFPLTILIDSGSTHNFLDPMMAKRTGQMIQNTQPLTVIVADGTKLMSKAAISDFTWWMQGTEFQADVRLLPLGGCDMVLGVQWLTTLGPVLWDFKELHMEFHAKGKKHVLRGGASVELQEVSSATTQTILRKKPQGLVAQLNNKRDRFRMAATKGTNGGKP